jgi:hypothetical protein
MFAGVRWSRDGPTANARIIAATRQKAGAAKNAGARSYAYAEASGSGNEHSAGYNKGKESAADPYAVASGHFEQEGGSAGCRYDTGSGQASIAAQH